MMDFLKYDDILKISSFFRENGYLDYKLEIVNNVSDEKMLNRINDDFYYRINKGEGEKPDNKSDEVVITVGEVKFVYRVKEE